LILTERGEVRVEDLAIGDMVVTISGEAKPIKWIGRRSYAGRFIAGKRDVLPIVVRAGALAPDIPVRDLWLSPGHALLLDGVLVPAEHLVNALTILQADAVDQVEYFHLEFEAHEVILAEGAPAESYVECENRQGFHNAHEFAALYPDDTRASFGYCLPRLEVGMAELAAIRARLFERAAALGHPTTADPDLHLVVDGTIVAAQSVADGCHTFRLDAAADEVSLASRCGVPAELKLLSSDRRCLGVCVQQLVLRDDHLRLEISHSHPSLCDGFNEDEEGVRRWTTGMGQVPERFLRAFAGGFIIEVHCLPPMSRYPLHPQIAAVPEQFARSVAPPNQTARSHSRRSSISAKSNAKLRSSRQSSRRQTTAA
jgi:Hint domain